jgi:hypothetical protein
VIGVSCEVCNKQRVPGEIHPRESKLLKGTTLLICNKCDSERKEPRAFVIIAARTKGFDSVLDYIKHHRYDGPIISAREILK